MDLIEVRHVEKTYHLGELDVPVLKDVSFQVASGELVALMGASGSGKTTLMNVLGCLDRPSAGEYWLDGQEVARLSGDQRALVRNTKIGFVFQSFHLLPRTSALDNVLMPLAYASDDVGARDAQARARQLLVRVDLGDRADHEPSQLSGGQQQRVAIARALINHPRLLLADEPTGNLDSHRSEEILRMFQDLNQREGLTILVVTHDLGVAEHARRIIRLRDGRIEADDVVAAPSRVAAGGAA